MLKKALAEEVAVYRRLLELGQKKTGVLAAREVKELERLSEEESELISQVVEIEQRRLESLQVLADHFRVPLGELTLARLAQLVGRNHSEELRSLHGEIIGVLEELRRVNDLNNALIERELAFINYSLDLLVNPKPEGPTYSQEGRDAEGKGKSRPSVLDVRA